MPVSRRRTTITERTARRLRCGIPASLAVALLSSAACAQTLPDSLRIAGDAVVEALRTNDLAAIEARFGPRMRANLPHDRFVATADRIRQQVGPLGSCAEPTVRRRNEFTIADYRCRFEVAPLTVSLGWDGAGRLAGLFFLPVPADPGLAAPLPAGAREEAVTTGARGWPLPGTLLRPASDRPVPIVVLVHGSGPLDRDGTIGPNKTFRDLAVGLAAEGIASLRYEKRTRAFGQRFASELREWTLDDEVVDDAVAAVRSAAAVRDAGPVFVVGHSLGALLAPRIAARAAARGAPLAGVVMLAAPVTPLADVIVEQYEFLSRLPAPSVTPQMVDEMRVRRDNVRALALGRRPARNSGLPLDMPASAWRDIVRYDPASTLLAQPGLPALLVFGGRDFQVPIREKAAWEARLRGAGGSQATLVEFPTMNHLLIEGDGPVSPVEYDGPGTVAQALVDAVARWILERDR